MTGEEFIKVWSDTELRQYIVDVAKAFSKNMEIQQDLVQEAWIKISFSDYDKTLEYYMNEGFKGMDNCYHKMWRQWRLPRWGKKHRAVNERVRYIEKKYI